MTHRDHNTALTPRTVTDDGHDRGFAVIRAADHYGAGDYVTAPALCGCRSVCLAPIDDR